MPNSNSQPPVTLTKKELDAKWKDLLGATLEAWAHMILYVRKVYPVDSFSSPKTTLFGLRLFQNRHPQVASYIADAIRVALPAITSHVADSITLVITELPSPLEEQQLHERSRLQDLMLSQAQQDSMSEDEDLNDPEETRMDFIQPPPKVLEKFELRFPRHSNASTIHDDSTPHAKSNVFTSSAIEYLEREMREILLSVYAMKDNDEGVSQSDSVSFRLTLHIPEANATCKELNQAFATGEWRTPPTPESSSSSFGKDNNKVPYVIRPLHQMDAMTSPVGAVQFSVRYPQVLPSFERRNRRKSVPERSHQHLSSDTESTPILDF